MPGGLGINAKSKNVAGAEKFLAFMIQPEQIESMGKAGGFFSPAYGRHRAANDAPTPRSTRQALDHAYPGEPNPAARQLMALLAPRSRPR